MEMLPGCRDGTEQGGAAVGADGPRHGTAMARESRWLSK